MLLKFAGKILLLVLMTVLLLGMAPLAAKSAADNDITADFTDPSFLAAVREKLGKGPSDLIYASDAASITVLIVNNSNISSLAGIDNFTELLELNCSFNKLTTLDVSRLSKLRVLYCDNNQLSALNVSGLTTLQILFCNENQLTAIDVSNLAAMQIMICSNNQLTTLDVSGLAALQTLRCDSNQLTELNIAGLTALQELSCNFNRLTTLNVGGLVRLGRLNCTQNHLIALDITGLNNLEYLYCRYNYMESQSAITGYNKDIKRIFFDPQHTPGFHAVTDITGLSAQALVGFLPISAQTVTEIPLTLTGKVIPSDADNQTIVWNIFYAGTTGAVINGSTFTAVLPGITQVHAVVANGEAIGVDFVKKFHVNVKPGYIIAVINGTSDKNIAAEGETVTITAASPRGQRFKEWTTGGGITLANPQEAETSFKMPANEVSVTANYEAIQSSAYIVVIIIVILAAVGIIFITRRKRK